MPHHDVHALLAEDAALRLHHGVLLGIVAQHLERHVELVGIVDGDDALVGGLVFMVEVELNREDKNRNFPVKDVGVTSSAHFNSLFLLVWARQVYFAIHSCPWRLEAITVGNCFQG